ncbi:MAG TPA: hypothetical protein GX733_09050 [Tissierellia bacterium]|nr:hypothetical protein [Tissierellia bacterium]
MKKMIAFVLLAALFITGTTSVYAAGSGRGGEGVHQRLHSEECTQREDCPYDGVGPQDGTGMQNQKGQNREFGKLSQRPEGCLQSGECLYDGEGPQDGTGLQYQRGEGRKNKVDRPENAGCRWQNN